MKSHSTFTIKEIISNCLLINAKITRDSRNISLRESVGSKFTKKEAIKMISHYKNILFLTRDFYRASSPKEKQLYIPFKS